MPIESTLVLIKPQAVKKVGWVPKIVSRYIDEGLEVRNLHVFQFTPRQAIEFYKEHIGKHFFPELIGSMCESSTVAIILSGKNAIKRVRVINGATNPKEAAVGTIRYDFMGAGGPDNTVHGSESDTAYNRESYIIFLAPQYM